MAIRYSGAAWTGTFPGGTRLEIVDNLKAALVSAGWTVASGSSGDWKLDSAATPSGHRMRVRIYDPGGSAVCARVRIMSTDESIAPARDAFLCPVADRIFRVLACPYQFFVFVPGTTEARSFVAAGVPWIPSFLTPVHVGWMTGNAMHDTDTSVRDGFRSSSAGLHTAFGSIAVIYGTTGWHTDWNDPGNPSLLVTRRGYEDDNIFWRWADGSVFVYEPMIGFATGSSTGEAVLVGQLWDAVLVSGDWIVDTTFTLDSRTWWVVSERRPGRRVALALVYPV